MKAQAAEEYLMTYGWAILIVIIILAVLWAVGVFSPTQNESDCKILAEELNASEYNIGYGNVCFIKFCSESGREIQIKNKTYVPECANFREENGG